MEKIKENDFLEVVKKLEEKTIQVKMSGAIQYSVILENMVCEISYKSNVVKFSSKVNDNYININLAFAYKITANESKNEFEIFCDEGILITIDER